MSDMTPEEAREALEDLNTRGGYSLGDLEAALETIAAETIEYGVEMETAYGWEIVISEDDHLPIWYPSKSNAEKLLYVIAQENSSPLRLVARRVSEPWEAKD